MGAKKLEKDSSRSLRSSLSQGSSFGHRERCVAGMIQPGNSG
jgi:hypothetical protein